jgi:hypothetical protein
MATGEIDFQVTDSDPSSVVVLVAAATGEDEDLAAMLRLPYELWVMLGSPTTVAVTIENRCDGCGCTDSEACSGGCSWAAPSTCSSCV